MTTPRVTVPVDGDEVTITLTGKVSDTMPGRPGWFRVTGHKFIFSATGGDAAISLSAAPAPEGGAVDVIVQNAVARSMAEDPQWSEMSAPARAVLMLQICRRVSAALATREEAPAEAGEDAELIAHLEEMADFFDGAINPVIAETVCDEHAQDIRSAVRALRAQPPAREDAQSVEPTPFQLSQSVKSRTEFTAARLGVRTDDLVAAVESFGLLISDNHPAPDALRVAVEALEPFGQVMVDVGETEADDDAFRSARREYAKGPIITVGHVRRAAQALAALQALRAREESRSDFCPKCGGMHTRDRIDHGCGGPPIPSNPPSHMMRG